MPFLFEKLDAYRKAVELADDLDSFLETNRKSVSRALRDQLACAVLSISLNLAEGNGRWHSPDKRQFFFIARGSVFECIPILQVLRNRALLAEEKYEAFYSRLEDLSKMISGLIKSIDGQEPKKGAA